MVDYIPPARNNRPIWVLECPFCKAIFKYTSSINLWRSFRSRGVPRETLRKFQRETLKKIIDQPIFIRFVKK